MDKCQYGDISCEHDGCCITCFYFPQEKRDEILAEYSDWEEEDWETELDWEEEDWETELDWEEEDWEEE